MEDLSGYNVMRKDLMDGKVDLKAIAMVMVAIATTHKMTLEKELGETQHQHYCDTFQNPVMVSITDQYIFTKPYQSADVTNKHDKLLDDEVKSLRDDEVMCQRAEDMRKIFMEVKQCLCHGDLHTGSIMANDGMAKMFDLEFAFMGPAAFDLGMFLANLVFSMIRHVCMSDLLVVELLYQTLINAVDTYGRSCGDDIWRCDDFIRDTCGFIGCELIRRVIGAAHVEDIQSIPEGELKALKLGKQFLLVTVRDTDKLTDIIVNLLKEYL
jgi:5-methylthioribose kinase